MDDAFGNWLAGFIDGEGCFRVKKSKGGAYYQTIFSLKVRDDERPTIEEIIATTGIGTIGTECADKGSMPKVVWLIQSLAGCLDLIALLDKYPLRAKKKRDYALWREAAFHMRDDRDGMPIGRQRHVRNGVRDWSRMIAIKGAIEQTRAYAPPETSEAAPPDNSSHLLIETAAYRVSISTPLPTRPVFSQARMVLPDPKNAS